VLLLRTDRQKIEKMIRLADSTENGWGAVREYKGLYVFAGNEEDNPAPRW